MNTSPSCRQKMHSVKNFFKLSILVVVVCFPEFPEAHCSIVISSVGGVRNSSCCCSGSKRPCVDLVTGLECAKNGSSTNVSVIITEDQHPNAINIQSYNFQYNLHNFALIGNSTNGFAAKISCVFAGGFIFENSSNITLANISFSNCTNLVYIIDNGKPNFQVASLHFINCSNILLQQVQISNSQSIGVNFFNVSGILEIRNSSFRNNSNCNIDNGGGIFIVIPNNTLTIIIEDCWLVHNQIWVPDCKHGTSTSGGGIHITIRSRFVQVSVNRVTFLSNGAYYGGGLYLSYEGNAKDNFAVISEANFDAQINRKKSFLQQGSTGGGAMVVFNEEGIEHTNNTVIFDNVSFEQNIATTGGGLSISGHTGYVKNSDIVIIKNSNFTDNKAKSGSAIHVTIKNFLKHDTSLSLKIINTTFCNNVAPQEMLSVLSWGAVYTRGVPVTFEGTVIFYRNNGTALAISATSVYFSSNSTVNFTNNVGHSGGAIALFNTGYVVICNNAELYFIENIAYNKGGAIFATTFGEQNLQYYHHSDCFIVDNNSFTFNSDCFNVDNNSFTFNVYSSNNFARYQKNTIYADSISQCMSQNNSIFCTDAWVYNQSSCKDEIMTGPANISHLNNNNLEIFVYPGRKVSLPIVIHDGFDRDITNTTPLIAFLQDSHTTRAVLDPSSRYISDNKVIIYKCPNFENKTNPIILQVETQAPQVIPAHINLTFLPCPPGFEETWIDSPIRGFQCQCINNFKGYLVCLDNMQAKLLSTLVMTFNNATNEFVVSVSLYAATNFNYYYDNIIPQNLSGLQLLFCDGSNRKGYFCGECQEGYGIDITSTLYKCIPCSTQSGWIKYLAANFGILTLFFLVLLLFNINITHGSIGTYILYCQTLTLPSTLPHFEQVFKDSFGNMETVADLLIFPFSMWNLDFQILPFSNICIHPKLKTIHVFSLQYMTVLYPILFIALCACVIELHARNCYLVVLLWTPFKRCFAKLRRSWNGQRSVIDVFAAFLIIAYAKLVCVTIYLLIPIYPFNSKGQSVGSSLFIDPSIVFLNKEHQPFFIMALLILFLLVIPPPLFFLLYQFSRFQKVLEKLRMRQQCVITLMDNFHGAFKDGTQHTQDCRWFAGLYFILRILIVCLTFLSENTLKERFIDIVLIVAVWLIVVVVRPYKKNIYNIIDCFILATMLFNVVFSVYFTVPKSASFYSPPILLAGIVAYFPVLCVTLYVMYLLTVYMKNCYYFQRHCQNKGETLSLLHSAINGDNIPHRILSPGDYSDLEQ